MYISCGDDGVAVEAEMGYVPNNPLFGLPLDSPQVKIFLPDVSPIFSEEAIAHLHLIQVRYRAENSSRIHLWLLFNDLGVLTIL